LTHMGIIRSFNNFVMFYQVIPLLQIVIQLGVVVFAYKLYKRKKSKAWALFTFAFALMAAQRITAYMLLFFEMDPVFNSVLDTVALPLIVSFVLHLAVCQEWRSTAR
jgi:hypothetical protein